MLGINKLLAFLRRQVGLRTDAASATGSLHAKIAEELARIGAINPASGGTDTLFKYLMQVNNDSKLKLTPLIAYATSGTTSLTNVVSVSGSGYLIGLSQTLSHSADAFGYFEVTIDGAVISPDTRVFTRIMPGGGGLSLHLLHRFNTSLLVRHKVNVIGSICFSHVAYVLD